MRAFLPFLPVFLFTTLETTYGQTATSEPKGMVAMPVTLDAVAFTVHADGEDHKMVVMLGAPLIRIDEPDDRYSVIYDPQSEDYLGLENSNYTYWEFSWPAVKALVATSKRYEAHMRDLIAEGSSGYDLPSAAATTNTADGAAANTAPDVSGTDDSGYLWKQTTDKKSIAGYACYRWTGSSSTGEGVEAWCFPGAVPKVQAAMEAVRAMNEPMALVPVRTLVPSFVFPVYDALMKGGVTPLAITWGGDLDKNHFGLVEIKARDNKPGLFAIPKLYIKTTLVTMDGMTNPVNEKKQ